MPTIMIPKSLTKEKELVVIPRKEYEQFLRLQEDAKERAREERDTDKAIRIYKKEKKRGKLKSINSLADVA